MNGMFTVKSAYFDAKQVLGKMVHPTNNRINAWKIIWKANVSPKVKFFVWRMVQGILPIGTSLMKKGIQTGNSYPVCGFLGETLSHVFLECKLSKEIWTSCLPSMLQFHGNVWDDFNAWESFFQ